jgi:putative exosortase-associated protein (TIGR04073 family)
MNARLVIAGALLLSAGCASSLDRDIARTRQKVDELTQRINQLEAGRTGSTASTYSDTASIIQAEQEPGQPQRGGQFRKAGTKLARGVANLFTGWVEIPKRIHETTLRSGALKGFTWGLARGVGLGFIRTAAGVYEAVTFPFPAPPEYRPLIQPEYVFMEG